MLARARYGWAGPWWGDWFYQAGGGALFDLGVYNLTTLCGLFGPVRARGGDGRHGDPEAHVRRA